LRAKSDSLFWAEWKPQTPAHAGGNERRKRGMEASGDSRQRVPEIGRMRPALLVAGAAPDQWGRVAEQGFLYL
jgi:hypothetical protein